MGGQYIKMILVMLGTQNNSFNRLLEQIDNLIQEEKIQEEVIVRGNKRLTVDKRVIQSIRAKTWRYLI